MKEIIKLETINEYLALIKKENYIILMVSGDFCGPCKQIEPLFREISSQNTTEYVFAIAKMQCIEEFMDILNLRALPTFLRITRGNIEKEIIGTIHKSQLIELLV